MFLWIATDNKTFKKLKEIGCWIYRSFARWIQTKGQMNKINADSLSFESVLSVFLFNDLWNQSMVIGTGIQK